MARPKSLLLISSDSRDLASILKKQPPRAQKQAVAKTGEPASLPSQVKDLLFKPSSPQNHETTLDSLAVEPWLPGRGAVGVKVEVTW
jgi:hypothetical protein